MCMMLGVAFRKVQLMMIMMRGAVFDIAGKSPRLPEGGADDAHDTRDCWKDSESDDALGCFRRCRKIFEVA